MNKLIVISNPENFKQEKKLLIRLFEKGLQYFHLRKHNFSKDQLEEYIKKTPAKYHNRIIIYDHFDLVEKYGLKGIHFNRKTKHLIPEYQNKKYHKSYSTHSIDEIRNLQYQLDYVFISPLFDSISKNGYKSKISINELKTFIKQEKQNTEIIPLGGINESNVEQLINIGLSGVALLGEIWNTYLDNHEIELPVSKFCNIQKILNKDRLSVLSIAGFDPSSGAGLTSDVKTFENNDVYGLSVCSAITFQNDIEFDNADWLSAEKIIQQIDVLRRRFNFKYVKIGLIENLEVLTKVVEHLTNINPDIQIIWDPILNATAGYVFHNEIEKGKLNNVLSKIYLVTPNLEEAKLLFGENSNEETIQQIISDNNLCSVLLKGGHNSGENINDVLISKSGKVIFEGKKIDRKSKHGTGCVLSSAIISELAKGENIEDACKKGKKYVEKFILSNNTNLGYHLQ